ncbi:MAG: FAD-binding protein [Chloroflexi bacterium]|nr:FAD-binding protein [Chloroflexota bacterium]
MASAVVTPAFIEAIRARLPDLRLLTEVADRESHRADETAYLPTGLPGAVALPTETAQVVELVRICAEFDVPIVPRGAGSGLSGGATGLEGALTIAFTAMDRIVEIDRDNLCVVTQPGVINARLKAAVAEVCLFYAPDPASFEMCSIGGNLGTNAGGLCCVKYGQTRDSVLSLEVVMADGSLIRTGGKNLKDVAGYSLTHLIVGSQGTLALVTEATLRLRPAPPARSTLIAFFPTLSAAGDAVAAIATAGVSPATLELMDRFTIRAVDDMHGLGLDRDAAAMLMVESDLPALAADDELARAEAACTGAGATTTLRSRDAAEADLLRQARRAAHWALERLGEVKMEDVAVPRSRVPDMLRAVEAIAARHDVRIGTFGHAGDGNLHPDLVLERGDPNNERITKVVQADLYRAALDLGGTVTGEHGIGSARVEWLEAQRGPDAIRVMRAIKTALDPQGLFNPGRVLP